MLEDLWILFAVLVGLDLLITAMRASLLNVRMPYLVTLREQRPEAVERTIALLERPRVRVSLRLWAVMVHFLLLATGLWLFNLLYGTLVSIWAGVGLILLAAILVLVLEFLLEGMVLPRAERLAIRIIWLINLFDRVVSPASLLLMALLGSQKMLERRMSVVTEDELKTWAQEGQPEGSLEQEERQMIYSIFQFGDTMAREIMIPRIDILAFDIETPMEEAAKALRQSGHSRVPVYEENIDHIIGLLYVKDLLGVQLTGQTLASFRSRLRPAYFVPESKKVDALLREMQARSVHMAVVVDEFGGIAGLVTLEDVVEEIVGEIRDEYDQSEEVLYEQVGPNEYLFQGRIDLNDFNEIMGSDLQKDATDTLAGFIYSRVGRVPVSGEQIEVDHLLLTVEQVSGRRIRKVRAQTRPAEQEGEPAQPEEGEAEKQDEPKQ